MPIELIRKFWEQYEKLKKGDLPNTLPEVAALLRLTADVLDFIGGGDVSATAAMSVEEAEAVVQAWANGDATVAADVRRPALRELFKVMWPIVQPILVDLIRRGIGG